MVTQNTRTFCDYDENTMKKAEFSEMDGKTFQKMFPDYQPMKIIGNNHKNFTYKLGVNTNTEKYISSGNCEGNGLYFTDSSKILNFMSYGDNIAFIKLQEDIPIWIEENGKCKTHEFIITKIISKAEYITNLTDLMKLEVVKKYGYDIEYIDNPSEQVQLEAVKQNGNAISYIDNPSEQVQLEAVKQNGHAISYIKNPSEQVQLEAVKQNGYAISYIKNPTFFVRIISLIY